LRSFPVTALEQHVVHIEEEAFQIVGRDPRRAMALL
jgi:hypothetical protein